MSGVNQPALYEMVPEFSSHRLARMWCVKSCLTKGYLLRNDANEPVAFLRKTRGKNWRLVDEFGVYDSTKVTA